MLPVGTRRGERVLLKDAPKRTGGGQKMRQQRSPREELHRGAGTFARQQAQLAKPQGGTPSGGGHLCQTTSPAREAPRRNSIGGQAPLPDNKPKPATNMLKQEAWIPRRSLFLNQVSLGLPD